MQSDSPFVYVHSSAGGCCKDHGVPFTAAAEESRCESWYRFLNSIRTTPARLFTAELPGAHPSSTSSETNNWTGRLQTSPLPRDAKDELDIQGAPGNSPLPSHLGVMAVVTSDDPHVSMLRKQAYRIAKEEWGCHYCAEAITTLILQIGESGPLVFHHDPEFSDTTRRIREIALQLYTWACDNPARRLSLRVATEQRLKQNTHWGPLAVEAIQANIAKYQANIDEIHTSSTRPTLGDRVRILHVHGVGSRAAGTTAIITHDRGADTDFPYKLSISTSRWFQEDWVQMISPLGKAEHFAQKIVDEETKLAERTTLSERYCHYVNHALPILPDGIRTAHRKIQMNDAAFTHSFNKAYGFFDKFTRDWTHPAAANAGLQRVRDMKTGFGQVSGGTKAYGNTIQNLETTLGDMDGKPFVARSVSDRIGILVRFLVRSKKKLNGNGVNGVEVIDLVQSNRSLTMLCEKAVSAKGLLDLIHNLMDPLKRGRRDPTKVLTTGQIASAEKALGNFTTRCASLESLQAYHTHTSRKSIWVKLKGIQMLYNEQKGRHYYYNPVTRKAGWTRDEVASSPPKAAAGGGTFAALRAETAAHTQPRYAPHWSSYPSTPDITSVEGLLDAVEAGEKIEILVDRKHEMANVCHIDNVADPDMWSCCRDGTTPLGWSFCLKSFPPNFPTQGSWVEVIGGHRIETGTAPHNFILVLKDVCHDMLKWCCGMPRIGEWCLSGQAKRHHGPAVEKIAHSSAPATRMRPCGSGETPLIGIGLCLDDTTLNKGRIQKGGITFRIRTGSEAASVNPHAGYKQGQINRFNKPTPAKTSHSSAAYTRTCWTCVCCEVSNPTTSRFCSFCCSAH